MPYVATAFHLLIAFCLLRLARRVTRNPRVGVIVRGMRPRHFARAVVLIVGVAVCAGLLLNIPGMQWGWWLVLTGREREGVIPTASDDHAEAVTLVLSLVILAVFVLCAPILAHWEEQQYRRRSELQSRKDRFFRQVRFGLAHLVMGVPVGFALALTVAGLGFTRAYLVGGGRAGHRGRGVLEATRTHLAYNWVAAGTAIAFLLSSLLW